jgi:SAM-dependent methyltransferase
MGTASVQGELWGAKARDWADVQEPAWRPVYRSLLEELGVGRGMRLLDIGCGAGGALLVAREMGAEVAGLDASPALAAIARERMPGARIELGEMEALPFEDRSFEVVTSFNTFQFAEDPQHALAEARRVTRPGGTVAALVWGSSEECELVGRVVPAVMSLLPPPPPNAPSPVSLSAPGALAALMEKAGLSPARSGEIDGILAFADIDTAVRAVGSAAPMVRAERHAGAEAVRERLADVLGSFASTDGVLLANRFRWVAATI